MAWPAERSHYCWNCGKKIRKGETNCPHCGVLYESEIKYGNMPAIGAGGVGWSDRANDPYFRHLAKGYIRYSAVWIAALVILIPLILLLTGQIKEDKEGLAVAIVLPIIFITFGVVFLHKKYGGGDRSWEGVVEDKTKTEGTCLERYRRRGGGHSFRRVKYCDYTVVFRLDDGGTREIVDRNDSANYKYFNVGDRVRMHKTKYVKYAEKYDKSRDSQLYCAGCGHLNDARDNYCDFCGAPMLKGRPCSPAAGRGAPEAKPRCEYCGAELTGGAYCSNCGAKIIR